jgi:hypothetical protein
MSLRNNCSVDEVLVEVITEGDEFANDISWTIYDLRGNPVIESFNNGGHETTYDCIPRNTCHTFTIHDALGGGFSSMGNHRGLFTVKLDDDVAFSGSNFHTDYHNIFGDACLANGNTACSINGSNEESMFRLELVGDTYAGDISWKLVNSNEAILYSAGPFGDCTVNSIAVCIPPSECYTFITTINVLHLPEPVGMFTVLLSGVDGNIQNYTSDFSVDNQVFLGSCYIMNFS